MLRKLRQRLLFCNEIPLPLAASMSGGRDLRVSNVSRDKAVSALEKARSMRYGATCPDCLRILDKISDKKFFIPGVSERFFAALNASAG
jgi:hypothetical protein